MIDAPISVTSTISRASFGIIYQAPFKKDKHLEEDKAWDADEGIWRARNQMQWYLKRVCKLLVVLYRLLTYP